MFACISYFSQPVLPSPTTTNGAHSAGCANSGLSGVCISASIERRSASAFYAPFADSSNIRVVIATAASELTAQCDTSSDLAPA